MNFFIYHNKTIGSGKFTDETLGEMTYEITQRAFSMNFIPMFPMGSKKLYVFNVAEAEIDSKTLSPQSNAFLNEEKNKSKLPFLYRFGFLIILFLLSLLIFYGLIAKNFREKTIYSQEEISQQITEKAQFSTYSYNDSARNWDGTYYVIDKIIGDSAVCKTVEEIKGKSAQADFQDSPASWNTQNIPVKYFSVKNLTYGEIYEYGKDGIPTPTPSRVAAVFKRE
jgi:hypothetical protein